MIKRILISKIIKTTTMKKLFLILSVIVSLAAKGQQFKYDSVVSGNYNLTSSFYSYPKPDTIPATLLVSNIAKKQAGGVWLIRGYVVLGDTVKYLGRRKKPVPGWICVWQSNLSNNNPCQANIR